jgi:preprotein translocase subunit YajC
MSIKDKIPYILATILVAILSIGAVHFIVTENRKRREEYAQYCNQLLENPEQVKQISQSGESILIEEKTCNNIPGNGVTHTIQISKIKNPELLRNYALK